jgi:hypothetical protein
MSGFVERIGAALVSPRTAMRRLLATREGGLGDVIVLLTLRAIAGEGRVGGSGPDSSVMLVRALLWIGRLEPMLAVQGVLQAASRLLPDVIAIVIGSLGLSLLSRRRGNGRELDLAATAWIPAIAVRVAGALAFTALRRDPSAAEARALDWLALGWAAATWAVALWTLREPRPEESR